jgi:integrase/recombinase XerD
MSRRRKNTLAPENVGAESLTTDFEMARDAFLRDCRIRNLSEHTVKYYRNELNALQKLLERQGVNTDPTKFTSRMIKENVILRMMDDGRKETAINARIRAMRSFFNFLEHRIVQNPMDVLNVCQKQGLLQQTEMSPVKYRAQAA